MPRNQSLHHQSTMAATPKHSQGVNKQTMVPLHLVEAYYSQALMEKDSHLGMAYSKIAKLSTEVGTLKKKVLRSKNEVKMID